MSTLSLSGILLAMFALLAGAVVPIQAASNAILARQLGHPLWASAISLLVSIIVLIPLLFIFKVPRPNFSVELFSQPIWIWFGGIAGMLYLTSALILVPKIGSTTFFVMVIAGQLLISALIEQFGWFGMNQNPIPLSKIFGIGLVILGVLCVQFSRK
ncbi:DMT family transporter [Proteus hauseri]|uniref:DMT family transporter n=1 Tax=Proteus hauseri TaxID=183417 RepID=UPI0032DAAE88